MPAIGFEKTTIKKWQTGLAEGHTETWLKTFIVIWAIFIIILAVFFVHNKWLLAAIMLYEVLP